MDPAKLAKLQAAAAANRIGELKRVFLPKMDEGSEQNCCDSRLR